MLSFPADCGSSIDGYLNDILINLMRDWDFLYQVCGFRFVDSHVVNPSMGYAHLVLESRTLRLKFDLDRGPIFVLVQAVADTENWYSFDLVRQLVSGQVHETGLMDKDNAVFLKTNMVTIVAAFSQDRVSETVEKLDELAKARTKRLFA